MFQTLAINNKNNTQVQVAVYNNPPDNSYYNTSIIPGNAVMSWSIPFVGDKLDIKSRRDNTSAIFTQFFIIREFCGLVRATVTRKIHFRRATSPDYNYSDASSSYDTDIYDTDIYDTDIDTDIDHNNNIANFYSNCQNNTNTNNNKTNTTDNKLFVNNNNNYNYNSSNNYKSGICF